MSVIRKLFSGFRRKEEKETLPDLPVSRTVEQIQHVLQDTTFEPGKKIHEAEYGPYNLRLDQDLYRHFRVSVFLGNHRIYSFTLLIKEYDQTRFSEAYQLIGEFLQSEQALGSLPKTDHLKGHFFGFPE